MMYVIIFMYDILGKRGVLCFSHSIRESLCFLLRTSAVILIIRYALQDTVRPVLYPTGTSPYTEV